MGCHMRDEEYKKFLSLYTNPATIKTISGRIKRIFIIMRDSVYLSKYISNNKYYKLCGITLADISKLFTLISTTSIESKKQLALTFKMLLTIYSCNDLLNSPDFISHMDFMTTEATNSRAIKVHTYKHTWPQILELANANLNNENLNIALLAHMIRYMPPMRPQDYIGRECTLKKNILTITQHKTKKQFEAKYGNNGARIITLPAEVAVLVKKVPLFAMNDNAFRKLVVTVFDMTLNDIRNLYPSKTEAQLYIMGKIETKLNL